MGGDLHIKSPSLPSTPRKVLSGHGTKSSILYLHSPGVRPKVIVRPSRHPLIRDSLNNLSGRDSAATRRNLGGTNLGLRQSCSAGDTSLREGVIITIVITNAPLIWRGQSPSTYSPAPSHLQTLVHLLYPILVSKSGIGASRLLVVLITPCS